MRLARESTPGALTGYLIGICVLFFLFEMVASLGALGSRGLWRALLDVPGEILFNMGALATERIFSGEFIGEKDVKEQALAWLPAVMRFGILKEEAASDEETSAGSEDAGNELTEQAA